jgi:uridine phosphorylase
VGTCGALASGLKLGELLIAREAISADGTSRALGASERVAADPRLTEALGQQAPSARCGAVVSVDLFYDDGRRPSAADALAIEMEAATLFAVGASRGIAVACMLAVSDTFDADGGRRRIADPELLAAAARMGAAAAAALSP